VLTRTVSLGRDGSTHLAFDSKHESIYAGGYLSGNDDKAGASVFNVVKDGVAISVNLPPAAGGKPVTGELLSMSISSLNPALMAVTVVDANYLALFDLDSRTFLYEGSPIKSPKAASFSPSRKDILFVNSSGGKIFTLQIDPAKGKTKTVQILSELTAGNGAHFTAVDWT
jgi:hypothetical protein